MSKFISKLSIVNDTLKGILGPTYGGPCLGFEDDEFIIYQWYDAPVSTEYLAKGKTLTECISNYIEKQKKVK